jgi:undecaprenyl-diphosphatase
VDYRVEQWVNGPAGTYAALDTLMRDLANWGQWIFIGIVVAWFIYGWVRGERRDRWGAIAALVAAAIALGVNQIFARLWDRPRPFVAHPQSVHVLIAHAADGSFPSDHASAGFAIAVTLFVVHRRWGTAAIVMAALMSYARVFDGVHYPGDVLAGALIGTLVALAVVRWGGHPLEVVQARLDRAAEDRDLPIPRSD